MENNKFKQFIDDSRGQKELSLVLASSIEQYHEYSQALTEQGFAGSDDIFATLPRSDVLHKTFFVINDKSAKTLYDFAIQYPTGQVNILNSENMESVNFVPKYEDHSIVLLTTGDFASHLAKHNLNFLNITGMVYKD